MTCVCCCTSCIKKVEKRIFFTDNIVTVTEKVYEILKLVAADICVCVLCFDDFILSIEHDVRKRKEKRVVVWNYSAIEVQSYLTERIPFKTK